MGKLLVKSNHKINDLFANYPDTVRDKMQFLRGLVIETAEETEGIEVLEETLKWGEPSFVTAYSNTYRAAGICLHTSTIVVFSFLSIF